MDFGSIGNAASAYQYVNQIKSKQVSSSKFASKSTTRTEFTESVDSMTEEEKFEAFKKEIWKELDSLPWNGGVSVSIQITDSAFKRMMTDEDFKNRMMSKMHEEASVCRSPIVSSLTVIDENGYRGITYNDYGMGDTAFKVHSKHKDSFYVKKAKSQEIDDAWKKSKQKRDRQRDIREEEYWNNYYARKTFAHKEQVADLYYNNLPIASSQDTTHTYEFEPTIANL